MDSRDRLLVQNTLTRRRMLKVTGAGALALGAAPILAACGSDEETTATTSGGGEVGGKLTLFTWEGYDMEEPFAKWREQNAVDQKTLGFIVAADDVLTKLPSPSGRQVDISSVNSSYIGYAEDLELASAISVDEVPALGEMYPEFRDFPLFLNDDGTYKAVPWTWGFTSISYLPANVPEPKSYFDILDPKWKGRVATLDDAYNNVLLGCIANEINPDTLTKDELNGPVRDYLLALKDNLKTYAPSIGDMVTLLQSEEVDYMHVGLYLVDVLNESGNSKTVVPKEGVAGYIDAAIIPPEAPNRATAIDFCNQLMTGKNGAAAQDSVLGGATNPEVVPLLSPDVRKLYPYDDLSPFLENIIFPDGWPREPEGDLATYDETIQLWEDVKAA